MSTRKRFHAVLLVLGLGAAVGSAHAQADWDVVLNGRAVHMNAEKEWNEDNWGIGVEREFNGSGRWVRLAVANGFKDSLGETSYMAGGGIKRRFRPMTEDFYVDVGVVGFLMTRQDVNHNQPFPGVLPALTVGGPRVAVNLTYMPGSVVDRVTNARLRDPNLDGVVFIQLKLHPSLFGLGGRRAALASATAAAQ
jgi:Antimicrobial peptide resistance and lipid A acylation protein PagP